MAARPYQSDPLLSTDQGRSDPVGEDPSCCQNGRRFGPDSSLHPPKAEKTAGWKMFQNNLEVVPKQHRLSLF
jgi:hypothetical protein